MKALLLILFFFSSSQDGQAQMQSQKKKQVQQQMQPMPQLQQHHSTHKHGPNCDHPSLQIAPGPSAMVEELSGGMKKHLDPALKISKHLCPALKACFLTSVGEDYAAMMTGNDCTEASAEMTPKCGLSMDETFVLNHYMGSAYGCINPYLWKSEGKPAEIGILVKELEKALKKFPRYQGFVIRGANLPPAVKAEHVKGATVTYKAFTSSSTSASIANYFTGNSKFLIYSMSGRPIMGFSGGEKEVLFSSNTRFRILDVIQKEDTSYHIMREVSGNETPAQAAAADKKVIDLAKANTTAGDTTPGYLNAGDSWSCPAEGAKPPPVVIQQQSPSTKTFLEP